MPPTMGIYSIWSQEDYDSPDICIDCLIPSGFLKQITVRKDATIISIKKQLWMEVKSSPISKFLDNMDNYIFVCVGEDATKIEITDESRRLCDVRPFFPVLKLVKQQSRANEEMITNAQISVVISKDLREFDQIKDSEVVEFRRETRKICAKNIKSKSEKDWLDLVMCYYPPDLVVSLDMPKHLSNTLLKSNFQICVSVGAEFLNVKSSKFQVSHDCRPSQLVKMVLDKFNENTSSRLSSWEGYILKVVGLQEYLLGDTPLFQFVHIRNAVAKEEPPKLALIHRDSIEIPKQSSIYEVKDILRNHPNLHGMSIFELKNKNFALDILGVTKLPNVANIIVRACLYHGSENLCGVVVTKEEKVSNFGCLFNETCFFDLELRNIPRMARLCFLLYSRAGTKKNVKKKEMMPIAWVNIPIFDYKGILKVGHHKLMMWRVTDGDELSDELLNPIGTVEMNPMKEAVCLEVNFKKFTDDGLIHYPPFDKVLEVAAQSIDGSKMFDMTHLRMWSSEICHLQMITSESKLDQLKALIEKDPLYTMCEQDKELMWNLRLECQSKFPQSLPRLLTCVKWNNHIDVAQMQSVLQIWQPLEPTDTLELLDFQYADQSVRSFAVRHIAKMSDSEFCQYLLQLVQVSKYESYLECDLIRFLLERALNNAKIGHNLFWLLRSEMHVPSLSVKFGLILEAYCRGNINLLGELSKEVEALNNMRVISEHIKVCGFTSDRLKDELKKGLENKCKQALSLLCCPLNPRVKLKAIKVDKCKCMDSKMKPLWLVWENIDPFAEDMLLMYKKGDDLRQDMLTLQILKIMDGIWQANGLDLRMNIYNVLPTAQKEGLIEVVTEAKTLANIQLEYADYTVTSAFNKKCIFQWLQKQNTPEGFEKALNEFTLSCAGYSVATYVLGVADRHSDNIMLRRDGQLFHIDFGHILGNFKSKWGVRRERCPFVLTADFVYVIKRGNNQQELYFKEFQKLCEEAFRILRQHSKILIILFMMMMNTGIPEISCLKDIEYLKETLVPHKTEQEALEHFRSKFTEALKDSWKTSMNHMFHNIKMGKGKGSVGSSQPNAT